MSVYISRSSRHNNSTQLINRLKCVYVCAQRGSTALFLVRFYRCFESFIVLLVLILISLDDCLCSASGCGVKLKNCQFVLIFQDVYDCLLSPNDASGCGVMGVRLMYTHGIQ